MLVYCKDRAFQVEGQLFSNAFVKKVVKDVMFLWIGDNQIGRVGPEVIAQAMGRIFIGAVNGFVFNTFQFFLQKVEGL